MLCGMQSKSEQASDRVNLNLEPLERRFCLSSTGAALSAHELHVLHLEHLQHQDVVAQLNVGTTELSAHERHLAHLRHLGDAGQGTTGATTLSAHELHLLHLQHLAVLQAETVVQPVLANSLADTNNNSIGTLSDIFNSTSPIGTFSSIGTSMFPTDQTGTIGTLAPIGTTVAAGSPIGTNAPIGTIAPVGTTAPLSTSPIDGSTTDASMVSSFDASISGVPVRTPVTTGNSVRSMLF